MHGLHVARTTRPISTDNVMHVIMHRAQWESTNTEIDRHNYTHIKFVIIYIIISLVHITDHVFH